jgi:hypothetical protein
VIDMAAAFMQYMRAHGHTPGPTQRPLLTGLIDGAVGSIPALAVLARSGGLPGIAMTLGLSALQVGLAFVAVALLGGALYGRLFGRAANDRSGAWLFGISFGFLLWTLGPATLVYWVTRRPLVTGNAALGVFVAHLLYGLTLGVLFPFIHRRLQRDVLATRQRRA